MDATLKRYLLGAVATFNNDVLSTAEHFEVWLNKLYYSRRLLAHADHDKINNAMRKRIAKTTLVENVIGKMYGKPNNPINPRRTKPVREFSARCR